MKLKYKYIKFTKIDDELYEIDNWPYKEIVATLEWDKKWKQWELYPYPTVAFTMDCLNDIIDFTKQLKSEL